MKSVHNQIAPVKVVDCPSKLKLLIVRRVGFIT